MPCLEFRLSTAARSIEFAKYAAVRSAEGDETLVVIEIDIEELLMLFQSRLVWAVASAASESQDSRAERGEERGEWRKEVQRGRIFGVF